MSRLNLDRALETGNVGAWVKIPGLDPREPHALNFLSIEELDKLGARVQQAKEKAQEKARQAKTVKPGDRVLAVTNIGGVVPAGTMGIVLQKSAMLGSQYHATANEFAVAFDGFGALWVNGHAMRKAVGGGAVR